MQYQPQIIYTRLNDVFESNNDNITEKEYSTNNYVKPRLIGKEIKNKKQKLKEKNDLHKNKYVNKDLIKSWIKAVQLSKYIKYNKLKWIDNNEIDNSNNCVEKIKKEFNINIKNGKIINFQNNDQNEEQLDLDDTDFIKTVEEKIDFINNNFLAEKKKNEEKNKIKKIKDEEIKNNDNNILNNNNINKDNNNNINDIKKKKITRRFKILKDCIMLLKNNGITLNECLNNNPFQSKPFQIKNSFEFIEAVKYDKFKEMEIYLKNPDLLFSFDYYRQTGFHWAAKKNKIKAAILMTKYGHCVNQIDINHMTPLAIAAKNNNFEMCQLLCENGANPFIPNNEGKKPVDLADDIKLKSFLINWGDNYSKQKNINYK